MKMKALVGFVLIFVAWAAADWFFDVPPRQSTASWLIPYTAGYLIGRILP